MQEQPESQWVKFAVYISPAQRADLDALRLERQVSRSAILREALRDYLAKQSTRREVAA